VCCKSGLGKLLLEGAENANWTLGQVLTKTAHGSPTPTTTQLLHADSFNQQACNPVYLVVTMDWTADAAVIS
jgi:hypothetical protein